MFFTRVRRNAGHIIGWPLDNLSTARRPAIVVYPIRLSPTAILALDRVKRFIKWRTPTSSIYAISPVGGPFYPSCDAARSLSMSPDAR